MISVTDVCALFARCAGREARAPESVKKKIQRILHYLLEGLEELGASCTVDHAMIARQGDTHRLPDGNLAVSDNWLRRHRAHGQDRAFWGINYGGKLLNPEHAQVAD